jgi:predicted nucleic acid-binding protein
LLEKLIRDRQRLTTDAEVLQELLHRYAAIDRRDAIQPAFDALLSVVDEVLPVDHKAVERAKQIVLEYRRLAARHAVHLAIMEKHRIERILSFDSWVRLFSLYHSALVGRHLVCFGQDFVGRTEFRGVSWNRRTWHFERREGFKSDSSGLSTKPHET